MQDICPECGGTLDTGWKCNSCQFDAYPLVARQFGLPPNPMSEVKP
jgi:tRNA(Ile2) C34 agmatinyltransferase TiaS